MRLMGLEAFYPKPKWRAAGRGPRTYPYGLRAVSIQRPDPLWSTDIPYVPRASGFLYLAAILDWFSRITTKSVCTRPWISGQRSRSTRRVGRRAEGVIGGGEAFFRPRPPSAPVKGGRGRKNALGQGRGEAAMCEGGVLHFCS